MDAEEPEEPEDDRLEAAIADLVTVSQPAEIEDAAMEPVDEPEVERPRGAPIPPRASKRPAQVAPAAHVEVAFSLRPRALACQQ